MRRTSPPKVLDHTEQPAGEIESHASDSAELARARQLLEGERNVLEKIMSNSSLDEALSLLAQVVEQQEDELLCSILLYDAAQGRLFHGAAPSIPAPYIQAVHGVQVGPEVGSCGASVYRRVTTVVEDIATHPNWKDFRDIALAHGLRACWSTPIMSASAQVLGTMGIYYRRPKAPTRHERWVIERAVYLAGIAIERLKVEQAFRTTHARYARASIAAKVGIWEWDLESNQGYLDPVIKELAGYRDDEIASTREAWISLVHPEDRPLVLAKARACVEGERDALEFEHRLLCRDGSVRWILTRGSAERDAQGKVTRLVGTDSDITDRVHAEHAVRQSEARFAQFVEALPQILWMASADNKRHYFVNSAFEAVTGRPSQFLVDDPLNWLTLVHPEDRERVAARRAGPLEDVAVDEFRIVRPDGNVRWLQSRVIPIRNEQGEVYMHVELSEDITDLRQAEMELARQRGQLAESSRFNILGEMVAGITHEITQPLTAIVNFAGACAAIMENESPDISELREFIEEIRSQSSRVGKIVHGLRALARRAEPRRERCNLSELVPEALRLLGVDLRPFQVEVRLELTPDLPDVFADRVQLQQVVVNLVRNACDALQTSSAERRMVVLRTQAVGSWVELECRDNGPGFPCGYEDRLFRAFASTKPDGMGVGLAICRTIIEAHRGRISASNNSDGGATVRVALPDAASSSGEPCND